MRLQTPAPRLDLTPPLLTWRDEKKSVGAGCRWALKAIAGAPQAVRVTTPARQTEASLAAGVGLTRRCMLSKVMIERGHVDTRNRVMTLVCINVTWGTTVQFVQVCTRLVDPRAALVPLLWL